MVVAFTTIYAISAYHQYRCEFESRSGKVYSILAISLYLTQQANERVRNPSYTALLNEMHLEGFEIEVITEDAISSAIQNVSG
jgi:hypothetical protein